MRTRNWSIRSKIIALVTVPLVALLALWVFATSLTAGPALNLLSARTLLDSVGNPGEVLVGELQRERRLSVEYLAAPAGPTNSIPAGLTEQRAATDRAVADFRRAARGGDAWRAASDTLRIRISQVFSDLDRLTAQRVHIDLRELDPIGAQGLYNGMVAAGFEMFTATATFGDDEIDREIRGLTTVGRGQEYISRIDSLLAGAIVAGKFTDPLRSSLVQDVGTARFLLAQGVNDLPPASRTAFQELNTGEAFSRLNRMMDTLVTQSRSGAVSPVAAETWHPAYVSSAQQLRAFELNATDGLADKAGPVAARILVRLGLAGVLGLAALIISIVVSVKVGKSIVGRLRRLRAEALEMAGERLPTVVRRLQRGEAVDVEVETPPLRYGKDEIGQLGNAFNDVQRTAVQSAVEEANVRRGINEVFLNIARRSQTLLHRQLALLDKMERRETEPQELEDLYRVDHLATRMRRHAEDLVILAGAAPGRGWRNPVPVIDVVRGAISEVEDYKRVDIRSVESASVLGRAVGDVIHLLAELLENAASFSPPQTRVQVIGQVLPNGYAIEIEDRGLGMSQEAIDEANRRLVEPPEFDPGDSARLGLFVVAQLANRHGIRVSLRPSAFGGVTAIVLVPGELVTAAADPNALPSGSPAPDKSWDRPLVGSGTQDPARHSLAALQWQGAEELRQVTASGRPVTINGTATNGSTIPAPADLEPAPHRAPPGPGGPAPSSVADGFNADGLVQRRRVRGGAASGPPDVPRQMPSGPNPVSPAPRPFSTPPAPISAQPAQLGPISTPPGPSGRVTARPVPNPAEPISGSPLFSSPSPLSLPAATPTSAAPMFMAPTSAPPAPVAVPAPVEPVGEPALTTEDGLPKRVRQASLAPQLRRAAGVEPPEPVAPVRSPEQVRSLMSALQLGTTRGRIDAARYRTEPGENAMPPGGPEPVPEDRSLEDRSHGEESGNGGRSPGLSFADAATVSFPVIVNLAVDRGEASPGAGNGAAGDRADDPGGNDVTRPAKGAE